MCHTAGTSRISRNVLSYPCVTLPGHQEYPCVTLPGHQEYQEMCEDTKEVIRNRKSKDRQRNGQEKKDKRSK